MKKDTLENFVHAHRPEFDSFEPGRSVWKRIRQRNRPVKTVRPGPFLMAAAIAGFILLTAALWGFFLRNKTMVSGLDRVEEKIPVLKEAGIYYNGMINRRLNEVKSTLAGYPGLMDELNSDMVELDSVFNELKNDLRDQIRNEEVIQAMIQSYRIKLQLLEDMLERVKTTNASENTTKNEI